jgi:hypothetical protein
MARLTTAGKTVLGVAALGAAAGIGIVATQGNGTICYGVNPATGQAECTSKLMRECPQPWMRTVETCPIEYGTGGDPTPEPTAEPEPTESPEPTIGPDPTPAPTLTPTPRPPTATPALAQEPCEPVRIVRWANVSPPPVGIVLQAIAGQNGGEVWTPADERWHLEPRETGERTAAGGVAVGAGLVDLQGSAVQVVGDREVRTSLPVTLVWPCREPVR